MKPISLISILSAGIILGSCTKYRAGILETEECIVADKRINNGAIIFMEEIPMSIPDEYVLDIDCNKFNFTTHNRHMYDRLNIGNSVLVDFRRRYELTEEGTRKFSSYDIVDIRTE